MKNVDIRRYILTFIIQIIVFVCQVSISATEFLMPIMLGFRTKRLFSTDMWKKLIRKINLRHITPINFR